MAIPALLDPILRDEAVTRGLNDPEARVLIEWLVGWAELLIDTLPEDAAEEQVTALCRRARTAARFVQLWADPASRGAALQLAASERCFWPMPAGDADPAELMETILLAEQPRLSRRAA